MRKFIFTLIASLTPALLSAQFVLTPAGFVNKDNAQLDYYVMEFPGRSKADLYNSAMLYLSGRYSSRYDVFNIVEGEMISLNGVAYKGVLTSRGIFGSSYDVWFNVQFEFRDGRIRVMRPLIRNMVKTYSSTQEFTDTEEVKDKDGKVIEKKEYKRKVPVTRTDNLFVSAVYLDGDERPVGGSVIFNKNGKLKYEVAKETLEDYFNTMVYGVFRQLSAPGEEW